MRITPSMLNRNFSRINPLTFTRKTAKIQNLSRNKKTTPASAVRGRQFVNSSPTVDKYIKLGENAETLRSSANILSSAGKNNIFENAKSTESKDALISQAKQMVSGFNSTMRGIQNETSSLNRVYRRMMENAAADNSDSLSNIGITVNKDKTLSIDEAKFKSASIDDIEAAIGSKSSFTSKVESMAENVSKNAISTATTLSSAMDSYSMLGSSYGSYAGMSYGNSDYLSALLSVSSRFNYWG